MLCFVRLAYFERLRTAGGGAAKFFYPPMIHIGLPRQPSLSRVPRKVRIDKCSHPRFWYCGKVGETVVSEFQDNDGYWAREGGEYNCINVIRREDATLLPLEN